MKKSKSATHPRGFSPRANFAVCRRSRALRQSSRQLESLNRDRNADLRFAVKPRQRANGEPRRFHSLTTTCIAEIDVSLFDSASPSDVSLETSFEDETEDEDEGVEFCLTWVVEFWLTSWLSKRGFPPSFPHSWRFCLIFSSRTMRRDISAPVSGHRDATPY